jgi:hypothetical protein
MYCETRARLAYRDSLKVAAGALIATFVIVSIGARQPRDVKSIDVGELRVVQADGNPRISLHCTPEIGAMLSLNQADGIPELRMSIRPSGEKAMIFNNAKSNTMIGVNLKPDGSAFIGLHTVGGAGLFQIAQADGSASLQLRDKNGKTRIRLGLQPDGSPGLEFFDGEGKATFVAPAR